MTDHQTEPSIWDINNRLERMEIKMDHMIEGITTVARLEERMVMSMDQHGRIEDEIEQVRARLGRLEVEGSRTGVFTGFVERGVNQVLALAGAALVGALLVWGEVFSK